MDSEFVSLPRPAEARQAVAGFTNLENARRAYAARKVALATELEAVDAVLEEIAILSVCGPTPQWQDVETYDGTLGVTQAFVAAHESPVGQLQWLASFSAHRPSPDHHGTVRGRPWATGGMIESADGDLFLTAGHAFVSGYSGVFPSRRGVALPPNEIARLMQVKFNFQLDARTGLIKPGELVPILELVELGLPDADYAILRLGNTASGRSPGDVYGMLKVAQTDLLTRGATLCMIQHPLGLEKKIDAGPLYSNNGVRITYDSLDASKSSSGTPVLGPTGEIVGVHVKGGCSNGVNRGQSIGWIRRYSRLL